MRWMTNNTPQSLLSLLLSVLCCVVTSVSVVSFISNLKDTVAGLIGYRRSVEEAISARALHENQKQMLKDKTLDGS